MKKFFYPLLLLSAMTFTFTACDGDEVTIPALSVDVPNLEADGEIEVAAEDTLVFKANVSNTNTPCLYNWNVNGQKAYEGPTFKFVTSNTGKYIISVEATSIDGGKASKEFEVEVYGKYKYGTFVLNEGNFSTENGKLTFISPKGVVTNSAYLKENQSQLGHTSQDLYIEDGKMYIISQDNKNNGDGILIVANAETLKKEAAYDQELSSLANPSHIVVEDRLAYIRDNNGIHLFNLDTKEVSLIEGTKAAGSYDCKNRMAEVDNKVYALGGKDLLVMENGKLINKVAMDGKISGVVAGKNDILWVSLDKKPAEIVKINGKDASILDRNEITEAGLSAGWGATPAISAKGDTIYFSNNTTKIYRHIFSQKKTEVMVDVQEHVSNAKMIYNNLGVNPENGDVYVTTIKGYGNDYLKNDITVFNFDKQRNPIADYQDFTAFPAGVFFTSSF